MNQRPDNNGKSPLWKLFTFYQRGKNGNGKDNGAFSNSDGISTIDREISQEERNKSTLKYDFPHIKNGSKNSILEILIDSMSILDDSSIFHILGKKDGKGFGNQDNGVRMVEAYFNYLILSEEQTKKMLDEESLIAQKKVQFLKSEIQRYEVEANEHLKDSKSGNLRREINELREKIENHRRSQYQDNFVDKFNEATEDYREREQAYINNLDSEGRQGRIELDKFFERTKDKIQEKLESIADSDHIKIKEIEKHVNVLERVYQTFIKLWKKLRSASLEHLKSLHEDSSNRTKDLIDDLKKGNSISTPTRFRVLTDMVIFGLVLIGEIFLIYAFTRETLKLDPAADFLPEEFKVFLRIAVLIFCLAYPLALGMLTKVYLLSNNNKKKALQIISRRLAVISILLILSIAILNPIAVNTLASEIGLESDNINISWLKWTMYSVIFFGITTLFSTVAGIVYVDMIQGYEIYENARKHTVFQFRRKDNFIREYEKEIEKKEQKISEIQDKLESIKEKYLKAEGTALRDYSTWKLGLALEELREASVNAYRRGYEKGLSEKLYEEKVKPEDLLEKYYGRTIFNYYTQIFNQNQ